MHVQHRGASVARLRDDLLKWQAEKKCQRMPGESQEADERERNAKKRAEEAGARPVEVPACPATPTVIDAAEPAAPPPASTGFASKFDRFGGASRQSMYAR